ncbi:hypothetical protein D3H35_05070 [Cohnella faecalis]|uniref:Uncharacterized protein n=1 Tax=Cohnella faecalis TaxID=2315694 RepID=A0A398CU96_9BACL|nr:hypothetical protein D3H35_05070 [Cohnella faecalis]
MNLYERSIVELLSSEFGYSAGDARALVVRYIQVIRKLGAYDNSRDQAERLAEADAKSYSPEAWLERLAASERERAYDKGLPHEKGTIFANVR